MTTQEEPRQSERAVSFEVLKLLRAPRRVESLPGLIPANDLHARRNRLHALCSSPTQRLVHLGRRTEPHIDGVTK